MPAAAEADHGGMERPTPERRAAASLAFVRGHLGLEPGAAARVPDPAVLEAAKVLRDEIRAEEFGGGMCSIVGEALEAEHGWRRCGVAYVSADGEVICEAHVVNVLADGTIVDATADQFGEGDEVRVVRPGDPAYGRYRPEFYDDYHPGISASAAAWAGDWAGEMDAEAAGRLQRERGAAWWVDDPTPMLCYLERQAGYAAADPYGGKMLASIEAEIAGIRERFAAPSP